MRYRRRSNASLFLMELMIVVLFFALGSSICIQVFAKAQQTGQEARELTFASREASTAAALIRSSGGDLTGLTKIWPDCEGSGAAVTVWFDEDYEPCPSGDGVYIMSVHSTCNEGTGSAAITVSRKDDAAIFSMDLTFPASQNTIKEEALP